MSPERAQKIRDATSTFDGDVSARHCQRSAVSIPPDEPFPQPFVATPHLHVPQHLRPVIMSVDAILSVNTHVGSECRVRPGPRFKLRLPIAGCSL